MNLADFLTLPPVPGECCGDFVARWLDASGALPGLPGRLDREAVAEALEAGGDSVTALACDVFAREGLAAVKPVDARRGDPVVALTRVGPTMALALGDGRVVARSSRGVMGLRVPVLAAWRADPRPSQKRSFTCSFPGWGLALKMVP